jgi:hypothetical protein
MVKQHQFERGVGEVYLVTDILATNRWAFEYRRNDLPNDAYYAINHKDGPYDTAFSDLQLQHSSLSDSVWAARLNDTELYTVLACHIPVQRRSIGSFGPWVVRFQKYFIVLLILTLV